MRNRRQVRRHLLVILLLVVAPLVAAGCLEESKTPICANFAGTERDSGYPCIIDHGSGVCEVIVEAGATPEPFEC